MIPKKGNKPIVSNECFFDLEQIDEKYTKSILLSDNGSVVQNIWIDENGLGIDTSKWESEENCGKKIIMN